MNHPLTLLLGLSLLGGCAGGQSSPDPTPTPDSATPPALTYHRDIAPILATNCLSCHSDGRIAPFTLDSYESARDLAQVIVESTQSRRMPPSLIDNSGECNTFKDSRWMSDDDIKTLAQWAAGPRAEGDPAQSPELTTPPLEPLQDIGLTVTMAEPFSPNPDLQDDYRCFITEPNLSEPAFVTGFQVRPGDDRVVHHVIVYDISGASSIERLDALEAEDDLPGYQCFGSPRVDLFTMLAVWAPGGPPTHFPEGTGLRVRPGSKMVMQVHYNTASGSFEDQSAVDLRLSTDVARPAQMLFLLDGDMVVPPGLPDASTFVESSTADLGATVDVTLYGLAPHLHTLGQTLTLDYSSPEGDICLGRVNEWDFNWQELHFFDTPLYLTSQDLSRLTCTYDTRSRDTLIPWGDGTSDEMCLVMLYLTIGQAPGAQHASEVGEPLPRKSYGSQAGPSPEVEWAASILGPQDETPRKVAIAPSGALWAVGYSSSALVDLGSETLRGEGRQDGFITRFDSSGEATLSLLIGGDGVDRIQALDVDGEGNAVIGGYFSSSALVLGEQTLTSAGEEDIFVAKISPAGEMLWSRRFGGPESDTLWWLSVGPSGRIGISGDFRGDVDFGAATLSSGSPGYGGYLLTLSPEGEPIVALGCTGEGSCRLRSIDIGEGDHMALGGYFTGEVTLGEKKFKSRGKSDGFLATVDAQGNVSNLTRFGDTADDIIRSVAIASDGTLIGGGYYSGTLRLGEETSQFKGSLDAMVVSISPEGEVNWLRTFGGPAGDSVTDVGLLSGDSGRIFVTGYFEGPVDMGGGILGNKGQSDAFLMELDPTSGGHLSSRALGGVGSDSNPYLGAGHERIALAWRAMTPVKGEGLDLDVVANGDAFILSLLP